MSLTNGTNGTPPDTLERYREVRRRNRLLQEEIRSVALEKLHQRTCKPGDSEVSALRKRLQESAGWEWVGAYDEAFDRLTGPDRDMLQPVSLYQDRRYGANWPFWRTWLEHARIRAGGRLICTQGTLAPGALKGLTNYVIGEGFTDRAVAKREETPKELVDCVQEALDEFRQHNQWNLQQRELFVMSRRDGEYFLRFVPDDEGMLEIDQILPEQIMEPNNNDPPTTSFGCINELGRLDKITGYNLCLDGDQSQGFIAPAEEVIHTKINVDRMVKRGLSDFSFDTYDTLKGAQRLLDNLSAGTSIQASIALIRQHEQSVQAEVQGFVSANSDFVEPGPLGNYPSGASGYSGGVARYAPGRIEDIPKGYSYVAPPFATNAQNFIAVEQAVLRSVAVRWNAPEWLISGDASSNNYASSITAESPFVKSCKGEQAFYHYGFHRTAREAVKVRCEAGRLRCMGRSWSWDEVDRMVEIKTEPPTIEVRNKLQEAQRNQVAIQAGAFSPQMWCQEENVDYEQVVKDLEEHKQVAGDQGPGLPGMGGGGDEGGGGGGGGGPRPPGTPPPTAQPGSSLAQALGEEALEGGGVWQELLEAHLLEAGFTGEKQSKSGARLCYQDGKRVPCPKTAKPAPEKEKPEKEKPKKPTVDEAHAAIQSRLATGKPLDKDEAAALATHIAGLTTVQVGELKKKLGLKVSGTKAEMAKKLVAGAFAKLAAAPASDPKHAAAHAYLEKILGADVLSKLDLNDHAAVSSAIGKALAGREQAAESTGTSAARAEHEQVKHVVKPEQSKTFQAWVSGPDADRPLAERGHQGEEEFMRDMNHELGYDGKPEVVGKDEMDKLVKDGAVELFRGSSKEQADQFKDGHFYAGTGIYGNGTYLANSANSSEAREKSLQYAGGNPDNVLRIVLKPGAKVADEQDVERITKQQKADLEDLDKQARTATDPAEKKRLKREREVLSDIGRYAALHGWDAMDQYHMVVFNRAACIVQGNKSKPPEKPLAPPEPGFTGTDANGHHWVNGKQVASADEVAAAKKTAADKEAGEKKAAAEKQAAEKAAAETKTATPAVAFKPGQKLTVEDIRGRLDEVVRRAEEEKEKSSAQRNVLVDEIFKLEYRVPQLQGDLGRKNLKNKKKVEAELAKAKARLAEANAELKKLRADRVKVIAGPLEEARKIMDEVGDKINQPVKQHGMTTPETMRGMRVAGFTVAWAAGREDSVAAALIEMTRDLPPKLREVTRNVLFTNQKNSQDAHWEKAYNTPGFTTNATGGDGQIMVYAGGTLGFGSLAHESGHNLAYKLWGGTHPPADSDFGKAQQVQVDASGRERVTNAVSGYGKHSRSEDFAEAVSLYSDPETHEQLKAEHPEKYAALHAILGWTPPKEEVETKAPETKAPEKKATAGAAPHVEHAAKGIQALQQEFVSASGKDSLPDEATMLGRLDGLGLAKMSRADLLAVAKQIDRPQAANATKPQLVKQLRREVLVQWELAHTKNG